MCSECLNGIYFEDIYWECLTCWFRLCNSCTSAHKGHPLQKMKSIRDMKDMPELNTPQKKCACFTDKVKIGMHCTRCEFAICLTCHLAPNDNFQSMRLKTSKLLIAHIIEHEKYTDVPLLMISVRGPLFFLRNLPPIINGCQCCYDTNLANHCGTCYRPISIGGAVWDCTNCTDEVGWFAVICDNCFEDEEYKAKHNPLHKPRRVIYQKAGLAGSIYQPGIFLCAEPHCNKLMAYEEVISHQHSSCYLFMSAEDLVRGRHFQLNWCPFNRLRMVKEERKTQSTITAQK